jgi:hypothetical protein
VQTEIEIPIIRKQKSVTYKVSIGLCIFLGLITLIAYIENSLYKESMMITSVIIVSAVSLFIDIRSLKKKEYKIIGRLILGQDELSLETDLFIEKFKLPDLIDTKLIINETSRDPKGWGEGLWGFNKLKDGIRNSIVFKTRNDEYYSENLLIQDSQVIEKLDDILKEINPQIQLIRNNIKINSIKDAHFKDYPSKYINTRIKK